jgi:hypothetical protein
VKNDYAPNAFLAAEIEIRVGLWAEAGFWAGSNGTGEHYAGHEKASISKEETAQRYRYVLSKQTQADFSLPPEMIQVRPALVPGCPLDYQHILQHIPRVSPNIARNISLVAACAAISRNAKRHARFDRMDLPRF